MAASVHDFKVYAPVNSTWASGSYCPKTSRATGNSLSVIVRTSTRACLPVEPLSARPGLRKRQCPKSAAPVGVTLRKLAPTDR